MCRIDRHVVRRMYDQGHSVVGVEGVEEPIVDFFQEHSLPHVKGLESGIPFYAVSH